MGVPTPQFSAAVGGSVMLWRGHEPASYVDAATARAAIGTGIKGYIYGLALSTAGSSSSFGVAAGEASDSTGSALMALASAYTKTTSAWAVGTGNGSLDAGSIANTTWYHVHLIKRVDTGVVDVLISTSATAPTLPTNYTLSRRIGSMKTNGSAQWMKFVQDGDVFTWDTPTLDVSVVNPGTAAVTRALSVPLGVRVEAHIFAAAIATSSNTDLPIAIYISDLSTADVTPGFSSAATIECYLPALAQASAFGGQARVMTNTSSQIRSRLQASTAGTQFGIQTFGWRDRRGRD